MLIACVHVCMLCMTLSSILIPTVGHDSIAKCVHVCMTLPGTPTPTVDHDNIINSVCVCVCVCACARGVCVCVYLHAYGAWWKYARCVQLSAYLHSSILIYSAICSCALVSLCVQGACSYLLICIAQY